MTDLRDRAGEIAGIVAGRLADPDRVRRSIDDGATVAPGGPRERAFQDLSLTMGYPGAALLFAELGRTDAAHRETAHRLLAEATTRPHPETGGSLYIGLPALAFATRTAAARPGEYRSLLDPLDRYVTDLVEQRTRVWHGRLDDPGHTAGSMGLYDVISGLSGLGRYLLMASGEDDRVLRGVLRYLVDLTGTGEVAGYRVPRWWVAGGPRLDIPDDPVYRHGHANVGVAHGIAGPLALLALAWRAGVRVPGQREAMERVVAWLLSWRCPDDAGVCWPDTVTFDQHRGGPRPAPACVPTWCYGIPGIARSIQLAGLALDRRDWRAAALDAMRSLLDRPAAEWGLASPSVCHGSAGVLQIALRLAADSEADTTARDVADLAAARTVELFDPDLEFGFRYPIPPPKRYLEGAGMLDGAAGTALALHGYATGHPADSGWDAALLMI
ncbi:lanthionine synthetase C-like protein [Planomonospora sphaerica]|uniref:Lanthionine synthetase C-like protein n=1 Tax=Planomonospora sphaerica TaxID=161355 RepID=A0A171CGR7_9ACTN|nr:lanthionine synthetase C family protein [Planomonospora sphaerica]GAT66679.1 lanthionine synthetase C-like protein [Planomonospora sphaerica]